MSSRFPGEASVWTALLPRSQPAWLLPRRALPDERLARKTHLARPGQTGAALRKLVLAIIGVSAVTMLWAGPVVAQGSRTGVGSPATASDIEAWGEIIGPDGDELPPGGATAAEGRALYDRRCAGCHGPTGTEGPDPRLAGGQGSLATDQARKTVGSYWPVATTLWDYVNRAMPFNQPGSLGVDEVYAAVAYVLFLNDLVGERDPVDANTLPRIAMPNRDGFVIDPRPDIAAR